VRVWVDLTNSPHVLIMRPLIEAMRADGHQVEVTARDFAQTLELCRRLGVDHTAIGRHGDSDDRGARAPRAPRHTWRVAGRAGNLVRRSAALARWARPRRFDVALGHASNDVMVAAALLRIPSATAFDYEWAAVQHHVNCRLARAVVVPDLIPPERLTRYGAAGKLRRYPGLKEEYYLADFEPDRAALDELGIDAARPFALVRTPPALALYHRFESSLFARVLEQLRGSQAVVLPRTPEQREQLRADGGFIVPEHAVDAPSLVAFADLVVSAGGTMNREAVALGTPVFTTFEGRLGAVDEALLREGRLRRLEDPAQVSEVQRSKTAPQRVRRDPRELVNMLLSATR
jgi:predicted glycosyltransferase